MDRWKHGLVIGKFYPPHLGHSYLIRKALQQVDRLTVIVCDHPEQTLAGSLRGAWLQEIFPEATVIIIPDHLPDDRSDLWAANTISVLGSAPDVVFTSEQYGEPYAQHMGCHHVLVDLNREALPISGTMVRSNLVESLHVLEAPVRAHFVPRVCIIGAESTGTTTLALQLAEHFKTEWVPEYGREYWTEKLRAGTEKVWNSEDFMAIARRQSEMEDEAARSANPVLICDTDPFATSIWHERYLGHPHAPLSEFASGRKYSLYLLTGDEIPFVQDGYRDGEHIRHWMHNHLCQALTASERPFKLLRGSPADRLTVAISEVESVIRATCWPETR